MDFSDQERIFGSLLGSVPTMRAKTNGLVIYKGYVVAEFGDTTWVDPTYSVAKSMMATVAGIAVRDGKISARRARRPHRQGRRLRLAAQRPGHLEDAPAAGDRVGRRHVGQEGRLRRPDAFGEGERKPRELQRPGTFYEYNDVRINRLGLSLLRTFKKPVPEVFRGEVMDPIGASNTWKWVPYHNSYVDIDGKRWPR